MLSEANVQRAQMLGAEAKLMRSSNVSEALSNLRSEISRGEALAEEIRDRLVMVTNQNESPRAEPEVGYAVPETTFAANCHLSLEIVDLAERQKNTNLALHHQLRKLQL